MLLYHWISLVRLRPPRNRRAYLLLGIVAAFATAVTPCSLAQTQTATHPSEPKQTIRGTVINSVTHQPVPHVLVFSNDNRVAGFTNDDGQFELAVPLTPPPVPASAVYHRGNSDLFVDGASTSIASEPTASDATVVTQTFVPPPILYLSARRPGFLPPENGGQQILAQPGDDNLIVPITPEARITGRILLPTSDYLDRIQVQLFHREIREGRPFWQSIGNNRSRADGSFRFADLPSGEYKIITDELLDRDPLVFDPGGSGAQVQQFGYPPVYFPSAPDFSSAQTIHLAAGATFQANLSPVRREYHQVKIHVGTISQGLNLEVFPQGSPGPGYSLGFNPQDSTIQGTLPDGTYTVRASSFGPDAAYGSLNVSINGGPAEAAMVLLPSTSIPVSARVEFQDQQTREQIRELEAISTGKPRFFDVNLIPMEEFGNSPGVSLAPPANPDDEAMALQHVHPGTYMLRAQTRFGYVASANSGGVDVLSKPLVIAFGSTPSPIALPIRDDGAQIDGTVVSDSDNRKGLPDSRKDRATFINQNSSAVHFIPSRDSTGQFRLAFISSDGGFNLSQLPPGEYRVLALDHQHPELEFATDEMLAPYQSQIQIIQVSPRQQLHLKLSLAPAPSEE